MQILLFEDLLRRRAIREVVVDLRTLYPVPLLVREIEMISAGARMILPVAPRTDQERHLGPHALAAQVEPRLGARTQTVKRGARQRLALPNHASGLRPRFAHVDHQRCTIQLAHAHLQALLVERDLHRPRAQAYLPAAIFGGNCHRLVDLLRAGTQRPVQHPAEVKRARRDPNQLGAAAVQLQLHPVAVRQNRQQRRHRGQRLRRHYSRTISRWMSPVTRASWSPMNMLISERTPKFDR